MSAGETVTSPPPVFFLNADPHATIAGLGRVPAECVLFAAPPAFPLEPLALFGLGE